jgi:hypothetical protein
LTFADFANCDTLRTRIYDLQLNFIKDINKIGMFGNSSANNIYDWIDIVKTNIETINTQGDIEGSCSKLLTSFNLQFLYSPFGSVANPQLAIVGARYYGTLGTFQWRCLDKLKCDGNSTEQAFQLKSSVSFIKVAGIGSASYTPDPPRIYAQLPSDVWYPFDIPG